jgi:hypothetical protein
MVEVDTVTFEQRAQATASFTVVYPEGKTTTESRLSITADADSITADVIVEAVDGDVVIARKHWIKTVMRDLA